jgi:cellulose synthase (UDP-forming)
MGYPIVTGCHNSHRVTALKEVGGFAAHEADDLLITILYRAIGWRGVYVPKILAKGLTPVDWSGYLKQQRRWARSVLDVKFRVYPKVAQNLPRLERVISFLHGLYYLHGLALGAQIMVLGMMLITGVTPRAFSYPIIPQLVVLWAGVQLCEFYRQRFFLDAKSEWGLHWRARILEFGKWPYVLVAAFDALHRSYGPYTITLKVGASAKRYMLAIPHLIVVGMVITAWIIGRMQGAIVHPLLNINTAMLVLVSVLIVLTEFFRFPDPYDSSLWPG